MKPILKYSIFLVLIVTFASCKKDKGYVYIAPPALPLPPLPSPITSKYPGLSWDSIATGLMFIEPAPNSKWGVPPNNIIEIKIELVQQSPNTVIILPFVNYDDIRATTSSIFYSIKPDPPDGSGEMMPGPVLIFARQISGIDFIKKVDVTIYSKP
jgi:hypothetical protein